MERSKVPFLAGCLRLTVPKEAATMGIEWGILWYQEYDQSSKNGSRVAPKQQDGI